MLSCFVGLNAYSAKISPPSAGKMGRSKNVVGKKLNPKTVFGDYIRQQVTDSSDYPTRVFGQIVDSDGSCTGTLIGPKHVLTAAHCIYDRKTSTWSQEVKFVPGRLDKNSAPFGEIKATKFSIHRGFLGEEDGYDYAVIELEKKIGNDIGWIGFQNPGKEVTSFVAKLTSYPGDKEYGTMWKVDCPAEVTVTDDIIHRCDTFGGMSGSTIRAKNNNELIVGVHTSGSSESNYGLLINDERFDLIWSWITNENIQEVTVTHDNYFPPKQNFDKVHFINQCGSRVAIVAYYVDLNGDWVKAGPWRLSSGEKGYLFDTQMNGFYYYVAGSNGERWKGDHIVYFDKAPVPMKKYTNTNPNWGDVTISLSCD